MNSSTCSQISDKLKNDVPDHVQEQAREMARQELARRLEELNLTAGEAKGYGVLLDAVQAHIAQLHDLFERNVIFVVLSLVKGSINLGICRPICQGRGTSLGQAANRWRT